MLAFHLLQCFAYRLRIQAEGLAQHDEGQRRAAPARVEPILSLSRDDLAATQVAPDTVLKYGEHQRLGASQLARARLAAGEMIDPQNVERVIAAMSGRTVREVPVVCFHACSGVAQAVCRPESLEGNRFPKLESRGILSTGAEPDRACAALPRFGLIDKGTAVKLVAKFLLLFALTSFVVLAGSTYLRVTREIEHFDTDLRQDVASYGSSLAHAVAALAVSAGTNEAVRLVKHANDSANHLLVRWVTLEERGPFDRPAAALRDLDALRRGELVLATVPATDRGSGFVVAYAPLDRELPGIGRTAIEVKESLEVRDRFVRGTIRETVITMVVAFGATTLLALISGVVVVGRPLRAVGLKVRRIGVGDLSGPLILRQRDEIGTIARELNAMCEQLAENQRRLDTEISARIAALEQLRHADRLATVGRLAAGIAHEIGTPLTVHLVGRMIVSGELGGDEVDDNARNVVEQTQRISTIIRQLLDFARRRPAQKACIDLVALAQKTATLLEPISSKRGVCWRSAPPTRKPRKPKSMRGR